MTFFCRKKCPNTFLALCSRDEIIIARAMTTLRDAGRKRLGKGIHSIPFQFVLPTSLPSTTQFPKVEGRTYNGKIEYKLRAELGDFHVERTFMVASAALDDDIVPCMAQPTTHELKTLGVLKKGYLSVGASVENSRVGRGQKLKLSIASRNDASVDIVRVRVKLVESIHYKAQDTEDTTKIDLEKLKDIDLPGLDKEKTNSSNMKRNKKGFERKLESKYRAIYKDLVSGENQFSLTVPKYARDSYNGSLMTVSHHVEVTFVTQSMMKNPSLDIPIVIGYRNRKERTRDARLPNTPIATVLVDDDIPEAPESVCDESTIITVGTAAADIPMATATFFDEAQTNRLLGGAEHEDDHDDDKFKYYYGDLHQPSQPQAAPIPSAPDESLLKQHRPPKIGMHARDFGTSKKASSKLEAKRHRSSSPFEGLPPSSNAYAPFQMYASDKRQPIRLDYSYADSDISSSFRTIEDDRALMEKTNLQQQKSQPHSRSNFVHKQKEIQNDRDPLSKKRLVMLIQELQGSIHDYEVILLFARRAEYRILFTSLTPEELRIILSYVSMNYQVKVARLLARQMAYAQSFTCEHCAAAVRETSEYFRSNMVEALLPFCEDLTTNRHLIQKSLTEWEQVITHRLFDGLYEA